MNIQWGNSIQQHGIIPQKMKLERISHPNYINFIRIKFRQNIPKLTWQLHRGRTKSKTDPDVPCYGRLHINESYTLCKQRMGKGPREGHPGAPCCAGHRENTEHEKSSSSESKCWMLAPRGCVWEGALPCSRRAVRKEEKSQPSRAPMRKGCGNGKARQKGRAGEGSVRSGDSLLVGFPWGCVMMRKESASWALPGGNVILIQCWS